MRRTKTRKLESISRVVPLAFICCSLSPSHILFQGEATKFFARSKNHLRRAIFLSQDAISPLRVTGVRIGIKSTSLIQASKGREREKRRCAALIPFPSHIVPDKPPPKYTTRQKEEPTLFLALFVVPTYNSWSISKWYILSRSRENTRDTFDFARGGNRNTTIPRLFFLPFSLFSNHE